MTYLRYFVPLVIEGNKRNIKSVFFVGYTGKYNCPHSHKKTLEKLSNTYNFELRDISQVKDDGNPYFLIEGVFCDLLNTFKSKKYSITYMTDYSLSNYDKYFDKVDHIIFPSEYFASFYNRESDKALFLGSPKYDVELSREDILKKYNLRDSKKMLVIAPRSRDINKINLSKIYYIIRSKGYEILVKTRAKDPLDRSIHGDRYFEDASWFPHTSMELIKISDFVVNFDSTSIKEAVMMETPIINFNIKPFNQILDFLYKEDYCIDIKGEVEYNKIANYIDEIVKVEASQFDEANEKYLFNFNSSQRILDYVLKND